MHSSTKRGTVRASSLHSFSNEHPKTGSSASYKRKSYSENILGIFLAQVALYMSTMTGQIQVSFSFGKKVS